MPIERLRGIRDQYDNGDFIVAAGPCSTESWERALITNQEALRREVGIVRVDASKPRTSPFKNGLLVPNDIYEGAGEMAKPWWRETLHMGLIPATEVMLPEELEMFMESVHNIPNKRVVAWTGARNTNHKLLKVFGDMIKGEDWVELMIKIPWAANFKDAAQGSVGWAMVGGAKPEQLSMCYSGTETTDKGDQRRAALWEEALDSRLTYRKPTGEEITIPLLFDPCHMGKKREDIFRFAQEGLHHGFDGAWLEVDPYPDLYPIKGNTDDGLSWEQFDQLIREDRSPLLRRSRLLHPGNGVAVLAR